MFFGNSQTESRNAGLSRAENIAFAAEFEIFFGDFESVLGLAHGFKPLPGYVAEVLVEQETMRLCAAASHPSAELVELCKAKPFGLLNDDDGCLRDIHADLDDGGGDQNFGYALGECRHCGVFLPRREFAVDDADLIAIV